ncbi:MAG: RND family efflux transporter MFP subunit [Patiriisocius sp.]|jgi:RND family efflux transporter MFP subunit
MNNVAKGLLTAAVLFVAMLMAYALLATAPTTQQVEPEQVSTAIRVQTINVEDIRLEVRSQGTVTPRTESTLIPEVSGRVEWISPNLVAGGFFEANAVLLRLDARDLKASVERSRAALARTEAEAEHSRFEMERQQTLVKDGLTSQSALESAIRAKRVSEATMTEARVSLQQSERDLLRTELRAPYQGLVRNKNVDVGQFISRGSSVGSIYAADSVEVRVPLADNQLAFLDLPLGVRGELPAEHQANVTLSTHYGGQYYEWIGKLVRTEAEIDTRTRMVNAVVRVEDAKGSDTPSLPVGLFVNAAIEGRFAKNVVMLPRAALRNQNQVLIVDEESRLRYRNVELLRFEKDNVIISSGLKQGDTVNLSPIQTVIDGMRVKPVSTQG